MSSIFFKKNELLYTPMLTGSDQDLKKSVYLNEYNVKIVRNSTRYYDFICTFLAKSRDSSVASYSTKPFKWNRRKNWAAHKTLNQYNIYDANIIFALLRCYRDLLILRFFEQASYTKCKTCKQTNKKATQSKLKCLLWF